MTSNKSVPRFAITMGDPAGIGPEIALKALSSPLLPGDCEIFIIGSIAILDSIQHLISDCKPFHVMNSDDDYKPGFINILDAVILSLQDIPIKQPSAVCGKASYEYIIKGIELCLNKSIGGIITNPISKEALHLAGIQYPGHTEMLADKTNTTDFSMLFAVDNVYVVHVTTHVSLLNAIKQISGQRVVTNILLLHKTLESLGNKNPAIAVSGLNPHAGENGLFGNEEILHIIPAIQKAKQMGVNVSGPYPPDTVFMRAFKGEFQGVVSMLHDHGFVALKSRNFEDGVNITVGLPIIRTSVGHGTGFDIAGKGIASEKSLLAAIRTALLLWNNKSN